ncbi:unnamed protein product [Gordionus sp. m RMFG-2023]|uniref:DNA damage-regulated autophagy modulator protein 1-like isoform X1 n=1 Tax=Gordionus sp. m RMFG-2023 TaxID=3053472 RepID=UPI0030E2621B
MPVIIDYGIHLLPIAILILLPATILITYSIAVSLKHVTPTGLPYISDTGTFSPESCIFGQLLNMIGFLIAIFVHTRYNQVKIFNKILNQRSKIYCDRLNLLSLVSGIMSALGLSLVANFQETNVIIIHVIGAYLIFGIGAFYLILQTYFTYKLHIVNSIYIKTSRVIANIIICLSFVLVILGAILAGRNPLELPAHHKWTPGSKGYRWHVISALSEWALAFAFLLYMGSFVSEFRALEWDFPQIKIRIEYEPLLYVGTLNINQPRSEPEYSNDYQNIGGDPFLANKINHVV